jgi:hypothetical protein
MAVECQVCAHDERAKIDEELVAGAVMAKLGSTYGLHPKALSRHRDLHLSPDLVSTSLAAAVHPILVQMRDAQGEVLRLVRRAETKGDVRLALACRAEWRRGQELLAKLEGLLSDATKVAVVNIHQSPEFHAHLDRVLGAVEAEFGPTGRLRLAQRLSEAS